MDHIGSINDNEYYKHDCQSIQQMKENVVRSSEELTTNAYVYVCFVDIVMLEHQWRKPAMVMCITIISMYNNGPSILKSL